MKIQKYIFLLICFCAAVAHPLWGQDQLFGKAIVNALHQGGYNIYFRHAATDWTKDDHVAVKGDWTSCDPEKMRQLSAEGRAVAQRIGEAIRRLGIPIGRVLSSEYCRARETAQSLGLGPVMPTLVIMNMRAADFVGGQDAVIERARRALAISPPEGTNTVFVAHGNLMRAVSGAYAAEAGAAIFFPQGEGEFQLVAQLAPEDWEVLARQFANAEE